MDPFRRSNSAPLERDQQESDVEDPQEEEEEQTAANKSSRNRGTATEGTHTEADAYSSTDHLSEAVISIFQDQELTTTHDDNGHPTETAAVSCGRGIVSDVRRTLLTHWKEEMTNFNQKTIAVSFFLFFACIAPAISFGAIYAKSTENWIGAVEMITATAWCGIVYALIGGQPMMINGGTGPVLAFVEIIYRMTTGFDVPFLTFNAWVGIWVSIYMFIAAFGGMNRLVIYATKFTDEIFSFLIATIFIINALGSPFGNVGIYYYFESSHKSHSEHEDDPDYSYMAAAFLSLFSCIGVVQVSFMFRKIKFSSYFPNQLIRNTITDFSVVLAIAIFTLVDKVIFNDIQTETLNVPETFAPTFACCTADCQTNWPDDCMELDEPFRRRPWFVDLGDLNGKSWVPFAAAGPAFLAFILVFLDDGLTWHLVQTFLKHGEAFHYDTLVIGVMVLVNSLLGLPWLVAATVRSLNHVNAMAEKSPEGKIKSVEETRLTHLFIHVLCLASVFALDVLKLIPMPVLYGVFLFMGLVSLETNSFWRRINMFFMQPSKYPFEPFTMHMKPRRMHLFTAIQLGLFVLLYVVKAIKTIAIAFPLVIACCIPIRLYVLPRIFTEEELVMIDSDEEQIEKWLTLHADEYEDKTPGDSHHVGKLEDEDDVEMQKAAVKKLEEEAAAIEEEERDKVHPLPSIDERKKRREARHKSRKKSISCPTMHMMFEEDAPYTGSSSATIAIVEEVSEHDGGEAATTTTSSEQSGEPSTARRRSRRQKTVSCPPHMLFQEAGRQVASNYYFG